MRLMDPPSGDDVLVTALLVCIVIMINELGRVSPSGHQPGAKPQLAGPGPQQRPLMEVRLPYSLPIERLTPSERNTDTIVQRMTSDDRTYSH